ncbi:MAG: ABC transporter [Actinobacteria bacterium 13_2_20CM_2_71_6]|nr:MAG: ABC transporter [Actinobacteria bacterium 13_2_20CM_2_71_6]
MTPDIEVRNLHLRYRDSVAIHDLTFTLDGGKIYGLLGRNGAGKTSLLSVLAGFRLASGGAVRVGGEDPFDNPRVAPQTCFVRETLDFVESVRVRDTLAFARRFRPYWDAGYAAKLVERFELPVGRRVTALSRGMRSALGVTLGLASRAPLTIFDEAYLGMDAPSRYAFYEELLADYLAYPRTVILSTHLIEEVAALFEEVVIIDRGRLVVHAEADDLRSRGAAVTGPAEAVDRFTAGLTVLGEQWLGTTKSATVTGPLDEPWRREARAAGLELGPVALQDLFVHLTKDREGPR